MKKDFPRLSESSTSPLVRSLLQTAGADRAPGRSRQRALVAASLAASTVAVSSGTAAASSIGATAAGLALKWLGAGFLLGCVSLGTVELSQQALPEGSGAPKQVEPAPPALRATPAPHMPASTAPAFPPNDLSAAAAAPALPDPTSALPAAAGPAVATPSREAAPPPATRSAAAARVEPATAPPIDLVTRPLDAAEPPPARAFPIEAAVPASAVPAAPVPDRAPPKDTFAVELGLVDQARKAVAAGNAAAALALLDRLEREHRGGSFGPEATAIRVEVLLRSGKREAAEALAQRFAAQHPNHPLARRVRALIAAPASR